jgi:hypothetical protein
MPYQGSLRRDIPLQIIVSGASTNSGATAVTLQKAVAIPKLRNSEVYEVDLLPNAGAGMSSVIVTTFGNDVTRILIAVYPPENGGAKVRVDQGAAVTHEVLINGDGQLVYDVVD